MSSGRVVFMNGNFVPEAEARISIYDSALMFGDMVFEMTRSFNKKQFKLRQHLERLYTGLKLLQIPLKMTIEEMEEACHETILKNDTFFEPHDEHRLMINVSRGPLGIYAPIFGGETEPTVCIADFPLKWTVAGLAKFYDKGVNSIIPSQRAIPATLMDPKIKNRSRMWYQMANIEVSQMEGDNNMALLIDPDGYIAEGTGANFFIIKNGVVITPEGRNILRGISRDYVMNTLCPELNLPMIEKNIEPYDVYTADEAFMTGTPFCMLPVTRLNSISIRQGEIGPIFSRLMKKWSQNIGINIIKQIKDWNEVDLDQTTEAPTPYSFNQKT